MLHSHRLVSIEISSAQIDTDSKIATWTVDVPHVSSASAQTARQLENGAYLRRPGVKTDHEASAQSNGAAASRAAETSLAERLRQKQPAALEQLYDEMSGKAFGLAYRVLNEGAAAEDVVQDVFLWVWNNSDRIDPARGHVTALLMTLIHRRSIDALRARTRREALPVSPDLDLVDDAASDLIGQVSASITQQEVSSAMDQLGPEQRQAIEMAYFEGMTQREIADKTGLPIGTVKSRVRLGLDRLRSAFGIGGAR